MCGCMDYRLLLFLIWWTSHCTDHFCSETTWTNGIHQACPVLAEICIDLHWYAWTVWWWRCCLYQDQVMECDNLSCQPTQDVSPAGLARSLGPGLNDCWGSHGNQVGESCWDVQPRSCLEQLIIPDAVPTTKQQLSSRLLVHWGVVDPWPNLLSTNRNWMYSSAMDLYHFPFLKARTWRNAWFSLMPLSNVLVLLLSPVSLARNWWPKSGREFLNYITSLSQDKHVWNVPGTWALLQMSLLKVNYGSTDLDFLEQHDTCDVGQIENTFLSWSRQVENAVDLAIRKQHELDPFKYPRKSLPKSCMGRCSLKKSKLVKDVTLSRMIAMAVLRLHLKFSSWNETEGATDAQNQIADQTP